MASDTIDLTFLQSQQAKILDEIRLVREEANVNRSEMRLIRQSFTNISEHFSRQEKRIGELRDDFETLLKIEVNGAIANLETRLEIYLDRRLNSLEAKLDKVLQNLPEVQ